MKAIHGLISALFFIATPALFASAITVYGTGMGPNGALADGSIDPYYTLTSTDPTNQASALYVSNQNTLANGWVPDTGDRKWISPSATGNQNYGYYPYGYSTTFDLTGYDPRTAVLNGLLSVDDGATIYLNGVEVSDYQIGTWTTSTPFQISSGFISGTNYLTFVVDNYRNGPTGLSTSLSGTATATPEPASAALVGAGMIIAGTIARRRFAKAATR